MAVPINLEFEKFTGAGNLDEYTFDFKITSKDQLLVVVTDASGDEVQRVDGNDLTYLSDVSFDPLKGGGTVYLQDDLPASYEIYIFLAANEPVQDYQFNNLNQFSLKNIEFGMDAIVKFLTRAMFFARNSVKLYDTDAARVARGEITFDPTLPVGLVDNTDDLIPHVTEGGWAPISEWTPVADLDAAIAAAAEAVAAAAQSAAEAAASAASAAAAAASTADASADAAAAAASAAAAALSETAAELAETNAAASETAAETAATNAAASEVAAELAETNAAASAAAAAASEAAAAASAAAAATAETNAETAETNAETAETNAEAAAAQAIAAAALLGPVIVGTRAAPQAITAAGGIVFASAGALFTTWFIEGSGGAVSIIANPKIAAGTVVGQRLVLIVPSGAANAVTINDATGVDLNGSWVGDPGRALELEWDGTVWFEISRR